jgi:hypothetical protein
MEHDATQPGATERDATCACGQLRVTCRGEPVRVSVCHCLECQRRTGSAFGVQARFARDQVVRMSGRYSEYERVGDSGNVVRLCFCPDCGSTVFLELPSMPAFVVIAVGAFADPGFPSPTYSVYEARRHPWAHVPDGPNVRHLD